MNLIKNNSIIYLVARLIVGAIFIAFAADKVTDPSTFANSISNYNIMPEPSINIMAIILPWVEMVVGLMLIFGVKVKANAFIATALLFVFTLAVVSALARGLDISCGCSSNSPKVGWEKVLENTGLILCGIIAYISRSNAFSLKSN